VWVVFGSVKSHFLRTGCFRTPNLPFVDPFLTRTSTEGIPNQYRRNPPEISNLPASLYKPFPNYAKPCNTMHKQLIFCKGFRVKVYEGRFYEIQDCVNVLALNGVVLGFNHVLFIFFTRVILISRELVNLLASICHV